MNFSCGVLVLFRVLVSLHRLHLILYTTPRFLQMSLCVGQFSFLQGSLLLAYFKSLCHGMRSV